MSSGFNEQPIPTFLAAQVPPTTALAMVNQLTPVAYTPDNDNTEIRWFALNLTAVNTLAGTQAGFKSLISYNGVTPVGLKISDILALVMQAVKENSTSISSFVFTEVTTAADGTATINLTPFGFSAAPKVFMTCAGGSTQSVNAQWTARSATSLSIKTLTTRDVLLGIVTPVVGISTTVSIMLHP